MYESPFTVDYLEPIYKQYTDEFDNAVMECVSGVSISVDKDELLKALEYDRDQYQKGYEDGRKEQYEKGFKDGVEWARNRLNLDPLMEGGE